MKCFSEFKCQAFVDDLCAEYRKVDSLLGHPKYGLPQSLQKYYDQSDGLTTWHLSRFTRNLAALERYEALISRLDPCLVSIEYFRDELRITRVTEPQFTREFWSQFFMATVIDSIRSSLDIYAKVLGWFFDLEERNEIGFEYKRLIVPLKSLCPALSRSCNTLYKSEEFRSLRDFRNRDKHEGRSNVRVSIGEKNGQYSYSLQRPEPLDIPRIEAAVCTCLLAYRTLLGDTTTELSNWPLGYSSPKDKIVTAGSDGVFRMPKA